MNDARLAFSIFDGDTKDGSSLCTDANLSTGPARLFGLFADPAVYVPADTHYSKIDKPLRSAKDLVGNLTRVQTFGETNAHWVRATVDPDSRNVFTFEPMIVPGN
jgi:hypothetical protein